MGSILHVSIYNVSLLALWDLSYRQLLIVMWVLGIEPMSSGRATSALNPKPSLQYPPPPTPFGGPLNLFRIDLVWGRLHSSSLPVAMLPLRNILSSRSSVPDCLSGTPLQRQNSVCNGGPQSMFFWMGNSSLWRLVWFLVFCVPRHCWCATSTC